MKKIILMFVVVIFSYTVYAIAKDNNSTGIDKKTHDAIIKYDNMYKDLMSDNKSKAKEQKQYYNDILKDLHTKTSKYNTLAKELKDNATNKERLNSAIANVQKDVFGIEVTNKSTNQPENMSKLPNINGLPQTSCSDMDELGNPTIYIFISSSMPDETLKNYIEFAKLHKDKVLLVLNGFVGSVEKIRPTVDFLTKLSCGKTTKQLTTSDKACNPPRIDINPLLFRAFKIKQVPAFVYSKKSYFDLMQLMNTPDASPLTENDFYVLYGDVSAYYAIDKIDNYVKGLKDMFAQKK